MTVGGVHADLDPDSSMPIMHTPPRIFASTTTTTTDSGDAQPKPRHHARLHMAVDDEESSRSMTTPLVRKHHRWHSRGDSLADMGEPMSPRQKIQHAAQETWLLFRLAIRLWSFLGLGWRWTVNFWRLVLYATLLLPGFIQMIAFYFFSPSVQRSVPYGRKPRQRLDIYSPMTSAQAPFPVVIFVTGELPARMKGRLSPFTILHALPMQPSLELCGAS